jgi:ubiquitin-conjugating enzyme E2 G2
MRGGAGSASMALQRLRTEFAKLSEESLPGIVARPRARDGGGGGGGGGDVDLLTWDFWLAGPPGSAYAGGCFPGTLRFPSDYPLSPPKMVFSPPLTHPNVYAGAARAGEVCISILHAGADAFGYERAEERWTAVQSVRSVLLSVQSMLHLADANVESPADVDAAKLLAADPARFRAVVRAEVARSLGLPPPPPPPPLLAEAAPR